MRGRELSIFNSNNKVTSVDDCVDLEGMKHWNVLLTGQTRTGKTLWGCQIASLCHKAGFHVIVVDPVGVWRHKSDLPQVITVGESDNSFNLVPLDLNTSTIYDISHLLVSQQIIF